MSSLKSFLWQRRILIALVCAISSFFVGIAIPLHETYEQTMLGSVGEKQPNSKPIQDVDNQKNINNYNLANLNAKPNEVFNRIIKGLQQQAKEARLTFNAPKEFQGKILEDVVLNPKQKVIALTFDDGPWPKWTLQVLGILKENNIKGTFFWVGRNVKNFPELAKQVVNEGHAIANHTWDHSYHKMNQAGAAHQIEATSQVIYKTTGVKTSIFRPPGGILTTGTVDYAKRKKYAITMWSADSLDYNRPSVDKLVKNVLKDAHPGGMILLHDGGGDRSRTVKALPIIIKNLKKQGYKFVTVPELLAMEDKEQLIANKTNKLKNSTKQTKKSLVKKISKPALKQI